MNDTVSAEWAKAYQFRDAYRAAQNRISDAETLTEAMVHASEAITFAALAWMAGRAATDADLVAEVELLESWR